MRVDQPSPVRKALSLTPLVDVVFLLLLFFMLASTFQKYGEVDLATVGAGAVAAPGVERPILVRVHEDGRIDVNAQPVEAGELASVLAEASAKEGAGVLVQMREGADTQAMIDVLDAVRGANIQNVMVAR